MLARRAPPGVGSCQAPARVGWEQPVASWRAQDRNRSVGVPRKGARKRRPPLTY